MPVERAQLPMAITTFGSGICLYKLTSLLLTLLLTGPVIKNISACLGDPFNKQPNLSKSYLGDIAAKISISQPLQPPVQK